MDPIFEEAYHVDVNFKRLRPDAIVPTLGSPFAAGSDLYAAIDEPVTIAPKTTEKIGTGLSIELPRGYFGGIFARSGLATKFGIRPSNCVGVCDSDYTGEYIVALYNDSDVEYVVSPGDRIAQLVVIPFITPSFIEAVELTETERGDGGFGSTGV